MCGISGVISNSLSKQKIIFILREMGNAISHRGPDEWGELITSNFAFGHNRLSIVDIQGGTQPMSDESGKYTIIYNGEIFNNKELRELLQKKGLKFCSRNSDTETVLLLFKTFGTKSFSMLEGMFAFTIFDSKKNKIYIVRDELGIKPLYYFQSSDKFIFGSEIKALLASNLIEPIINGELLPDYFFNRATTNEKTLFKGINKLLPGKYICIDPEDLSFKIKSFLKTDINRSNINNFNYEKFNQLLQYQVMKHLEADVPVAIALSEGIDSSLITHYASLIKSEVSTFSIGSNSSYDESRWSNMVSKKYKTKHSLINISNKDLISSFDNWMLFNDDPIGDPSALAFFNLSKEVRSKGIKVLLCGEGADEIFGGYYSYAIWMIFKRIIKIPFSLKFFKFWNNFIKNKRINDYIYMIENFGNASFLGTTHNISFDQLRKLFNNKNSLNVVLNNFETLTKNNSNPLDILHFDQTVRLPNDLLIRADKASMAFGVEARVPYLSKAVYKFSRSLDLKNHIRIFPYVMTKKILKKISKKIFGHSFTFRRKNGFQLPVNKWISDDLKSKYEYYLKKKALNNYLNYKFIKDCFESNQDNIHTSLLWHWIVIEEWHKKWILKNKESINLIKKRNYDLNFK